MQLNGDREHGPVRTTAPQAIAQVNFQAAGALIAIYARGVNGGQDSTWTSPCRRR